MIFKVLKAMAVGHEKTQRVLWKYKDEFVLKRLKANKQIGELDLVLVILQSSEMVTKCRDFSDFISAINKRTCPANTRVIYGVFNILHKLNSSEFIKTTVLKVAENPEKFFEINDIDSLEENLNLLSVLQDILNNKEMSNLRQKLVESFKIERMFDKIVDLQSKGAKIFRELTKNMKEGESANNEIEAESMKIYDIERAEQSVEKITETVFYIYKELYFNKRYSKFLNYKNIVAFREELLEPHLTHILKIIKANEPLRSDSMEGDSNMNHYHFVLFPKMIKFALSYILSHRERLCKQVKPAECEETWDELISSVIKKLKTISHYTEKAMQIEPDENPLHRNATIQRIQTMKHSPIPLFKSFNKKKVLSFKTQNDSDYEETNTMLHDTMSKLWRKILKKIVSSKESADLVEKDYEAFAMYLYDLIVQTDLEGRLRYTASNFIEKAIVYTVL